MTTVDRLAELQARADAATEGPWEWEATNPTMAGANWNLRIAGRPGIRLAVSEYQHGPANAEFIAHARADVPRLVAALRAVLDLHKPVTYSSLGDGTYCGECVEPDLEQPAPYPCPTVRVIEAALGEVAP